MDTIGIDVGGVIMDRANDDTDTSFFSDNYLKTTASPEAFETIKELIGRKFGGHAYIVSKCGKKIQQKTLDWLEHHRFYERTGFKQEHVHFCLKRDGKAEVCKRLEVTHFIDDRLEVLSHLVPFVPNLYLFCPNEQEIEQFRDALPRVKRVQSWAEVSRLILG